MLYPITAVVLIVYIVAVWILGGVLQLKSPDIWVFRLGLSLIGIGAAAAWIWWRRSQQPGGVAAAPIDPSNEIDLIARDAEAKLAGARVAQGAHVANFPLIFLLGESGAAKTSIAVNSGLDAELLAGNIYQDNAVAPTRAANFWFTRNAIFAEAAGRLLGDKALWTRFVQRC
jgi:type VI secretion system protein ImpL